jgi:hypothetical protein
LNGGFARSLKEGYEMAGQERQLDEDGEGSSTTDDRQWERVSVAEAREEEEEQAVQKEERKEVEILQDHEDKREVAAAADNIGQKKDEPEIKEDYKIDFSFDGSSSDYFPEISAGNNSYQQEKLERETHPAYRAPLQLPEVPEERPSSAAADFFPDFDGVHYTPESFTPPPPSTSAPPQRPQYDPPYTDQSRRISNASPLTSTSNNSRDSGLVYYPAPVPAVLNLPPLMAKDSKARSRLSKVQKRASQQILLDVAIGDEKRRSTLDPDGAQTPPTPRRLSNLPPALRASAYFDTMSPTNSTPHLELKESSAVATLDSILDASASAPPAAFTDHPMTGTTSTAHLPRDYRQSVSMNVTHHPGDSRPSSVVGDAQYLQNPPQHQLRQSASFEAREAAMGSNMDNLHSAPTTLLAELESRKAQQKSRARTAASAFPSGVRSTLLELDAVAQVQVTTRKNRRTYLAWEDPEMEAPHGEDEDIPLGALFPGAGARGAGRGAFAGDEDIPLGLLMQREQEEGETLAQRRARLQKGKAPQLPSPGVPKEEEEETLAQRRARLQKEKSGFGDGSLGLDINFGGSGQPTPQPTPPPEEESLAQRRRRLKEEEERRRRADEARHVQAEVRKRQTMMSQHGTMLSPGMMQQGNRMSMMSMGGSTPMNRPSTGGPSGGLVNQIGGSMLRPQMSTGNLRPQMSLGNLRQRQSMMSMAGMQGMPGMPMGQMGPMPGMGMGGMPGQMQMGMGMNGMPMGMPMMPQGMTYGAMAMPGAMGMMSQQQEMEMTSKQREMVERWRASVM